MDTLKDKAAIILKFYSNPAGPAFSQDNDVVILSDLYGARLDPSSKEPNISSKVGIDATESLDCRQRFERVAVPAEATTKATRILRKYLPS